MSGLIEEIQRDALDKSSSADTLLRKVKLAAAKLGLSDLESWVGLELTGYPDDLPPYRSVIAAPAAWNPFNGWIPIHSDSQEFMEAISTAEIRQSIASLQDLLDNNSSGVMNLPAAPEMINMLNKVSDHQSAKVVFQISRGHVVNIISTVRNMVLDWAIEMEKKGVLGTGMSFAPEEQSQAQQAMPSINIAHVGSIVGNIGTHNAIGDINIDSSTTQHLLDLASKLRSALPALDSEGIDCKQLESIIDDLELEAGNVEPEVGKLKGLLSSAQTVLLGAAGSLTAEGAMSLITSALEKLAGG